jgi:signal transduction histidine kinase
MRRTLSRKLILVNVILVAGVLSLGAAALWGLASVRTTLEQTTHEYDEFRIIEGVLRHVANAKSAALDDDPDPELAKGEIRLALDQLADFREFQETEEVAEEVHQASEMSLEGRIRERLDTAAAALDAEPAAGGVAASFAPAIDAALDAIDRLAAQTDVQGAEEEAERRAALTQSIIFAVVGAIVLLCASVSILGYRSVMLPLRRLKTSVRRISDGRLDERLSPEHEQEFADLAHDFNHMVEQLDSLYQTLEAKVAARSRELVRSERLASVGFLAAGVAHEISTPLNIITGYAELSQKDLDQEPDEKKRDELRQSLHVICEESYRCKGIIQQLLSMARRNEDVRTAVPLPRVAESVVTMLGGMKRHHDKSILVDVKAVGRLAVLANEAELKQVILNLAVNALEAVEPFKGEVRIEIDRSDEHVHLTVADNGCGMTAEVVDHVFEPFFTQRSKGAPRGVGLGLSVSYAIIESHGGRMSAESDGQGRGSRFTIELPSHEGTTSDGADGAEEPERPARARG